MINYFNFQTFKNKILITNEMGYFAFLKPEQFEQLLHDEIAYDSDYGAELVEKNFIYKDAEQSFINRSANLLRDSKRFLFQGPSLHIFVLTNACNLQCIYCQAQRDSKVANNGRMSFEIAEKAVDFALQSPGKYLTFEFQGGEPLLNFETLKHIVKYTESKRGEHIVQYTVVSNLTILNSEMLAFIKENNIGISTSLDGNEVIHNLNRAYKNGGGSYHDVIEKIEGIREQGIYVGAIQTTSRNSIANAAEIVKAYVDNGMDYIFIRPLTPLGCASNRWNDIGYSAEDFVVFYRECLNYIIDVNRNGIRLIEGHASIFLKKLLDLDSGNYMELRSPCGGVIGQLAYYYDGDIYTCDEGRMVGEMGVDAFKLGNVNKDGYNDIICSGKCKALMAASFLESIPECCDCVYHPYCGSCPVLNFVLEKDIFPTAANNYKCKIYKGMMEVIFEYLYMEDDEVIQIFKSWIH